MDHGATNPDEARRSRGGEIDLIGETADPARGGEPSVSIHAASNRTTATAIVRFVAAAGATPPRYASAGSAGADLYAYLPNSVTMKPGERQLIPTGIRMEIPAGWEGQVRPRSGLAAKHGITVLNTPGTIDSDYRGEVKVILANFGAEPYTVRSGDRIAQIVIAPAIQAVFQQTETIGETERGSGGFGSTGKSD